MELEFKKEDSKLIVSFKGRLDTTTSREAEEEINKNLDKINELLIDFTNLEYISSAGLRLLLKLQKEFVNKGGMTIENPNDIVKEIFKVTGFSNILNIKG